MPILEICVTGRLATISAMTYRHLKCGLAVLAILVGPLAWGTEEIMVELPRPQLVSDRSFEAALAGRHSVRDFDAEPLSLEAVSQLLWAAQGANRADGRRTSPSAGALYPLEVYLLAGEVLGLETGLYRYISNRHRLQRILGADRRVELADAALGQGWISDAPLALVIAAVYGRTEAKYGVRARRYVHIEAGHAAQNVLLQAVSLGLGGTVVGAFDDARLQRRLAMPDNETPLLIIPLGRPR